MSERNSYYSLRNNPEEHSSNLPRGGGLKSNAVFDTLCAFVGQVSFSLQASALSVIIVNVLVLVL
jgi:hypothetical protein